MKRDFILPSPQDPEYLRGFPIEEMKQRRQWVGFKIIPNRKGKPRKLPKIAAHPDQDAKSNDPATWGTFAEAVAGLEAGRYSAAGYALAREMIGIDLDGPRWASAERQATPEALALVKQCGSYSEWSISRKGIHILLRAKLGTAGRRNNRAGVEIYQSKRFLIVTGDRIDGTPGGLVENQAAVDWVWGTFFDARKVNKDSESTEDMTSVASAHSESSAISDLSVFSALSESLSVEDVLNATQPTKTGERNGCIMDLARGLKLNAGLAGKPPGELRPIVLRWHRRALPVIGTPEFDVTWADFLRAFHGAKIPLGVKLDDWALQRAKMLPPPPEALEYQSAPVRLLVGMCRELATLGGNGGFFLSSHRVKALLGVPQKSALAWLNMLCVDGVLARVESGHEYRATRYRWDGLKNRVDKSADAD